MNISLVNKVNSYINNDDINHKIFQFSKQFEGVELYIVGGYIRDIILDKDTVDKDYTICGISAIEFAEKLTKELDGHLVVLDKRHDIARVVLSDKKTYLDFAACLGNSILEDLSRRDFTVNAIAKKLDFDSQSDIIDPYNGYDDILSKTIRAISEKNIEDDSLRILRAYRIAAQLSAEIDDKTIIFIKKHLSLLKNISVERIQAEFSKLLFINNSFNYIKKMTDSGVLECLIPEMSELRKVPENVYHHLGLFDHTLEVYRQIELLYDEATEQIKNYLNEYICPSTQRIVVLKYAALLHDIAKPKTWVITDEGKHTFLGHPDDGAVIADEICKRLKLPNAVVKRVTKLVKYHLYPSQLSHYDCKPTRKAVLRFFRRLEKEVPEVIILAIADRNSAVGPLITDDILNKRVELLYDLLDDYFKTMTAIETLPKLINGNDVMKLLNLKPSIEVGIILDKIRNLQTEGEINTSEEAKAWLITNYKKLFFNFN